MADIQRPVRWPLLVSLVATLGILFIACAMILDLRGEIGARAHDGSENLLRTVERDIARNLEVLDLSLQGVLDGLARPDVMAADPKIRNLVLFDRSASATSLGALVVFDEHGILRVDSGNLVPRSIAPVTDRDYFQAQLEPGRGLFISRPYTSRLIGKTVIGLSRRISHPDGSFGGVVLATIQVSYFTDLMSQLKLGSGGIVSLVRDDGAVLVRSSNASARRDNLLGSPVFERMRSAAAGTFVGTSRVDQIERSYTFTHVADWPLILSVGLATRDIYAKWTEKALWAGLVLLGMCLVVVALTVTLTRELRRRAVAEQSLLVANTELARLSVTDSLTELGNRRIFDEALARETRRAARTRRPLSLVVIDVDHFKRFNDRYGHAEGDRALRIVADLMRTGGARPGDMACRIGREEFALILPETTLSGALQVAENLRLAIKAAARPHADSPAGILTLSLGVTEVSGGDAADAFARADAALYRSKQAGRDRVSPAKSWPVAA